MVTSHRRNRAFVALFLLMLALPPLAHSLRAGVMQVRENRTLAAVPAVPTGLDGIKAFTLALEAYLNDHFGFRAALITGNAWLRERLGIANHKQLLVGRDGWMYFRGDRSIEQYRGLDRFAPAELARWIDAMQARQAWLAARGIRFIVMVAPDKQSIYPEFLPAWVQPVVPTRRLDQVVAAARARALPLIDPRAALIAAKPTAQLYHRYDSHWAAAGAFVAYTELMTALDRLMGPIVALGPEDVQWHRAGAADGDLAGLTGAPAQRREAPLEASVSAPVGTIDMPAGQGGFGPSYRETTTAPSRNRITVLVLGDSFIHAMLPFLRPSFRTLVIRHHGELEFDARLIEATHPDIVVYEIVERYLYYPVTNPPARDGLPLTRAE